MQHSRLRPLPTTPRVTVITVCKDRGWCIEGCVQSVLRQSYPNIEYLVQDGDSQDNTLEVLKKFGDRVKVRSESDGGPTDAVHRALARATGDIFCMLHSDEKFADSDVVLGIVDAFQRHPESGAIYGDFRVVDAEYREIRIETRRQVSFEQIFCLEDFIPPCAAFVRTDTLKTAGQVNADLRTFFDSIGDYGLWVYIGSRYPLTYVPGIIADFMVHGGEVSYGLAHCQAYIRECETVIECFHGKAYPPQKLVALKRRALARLYLNYSNQLAGKYFSAPIQLAWRGVRKSPRLVLTRTFLAVLVKSVGLASLLPTRADGKRMKHFRTSVPAARG